VQYAAWIASWALAPTLLLFAAMLFLMFPNGRFLSAEWHFVAGVAVVASVMVALGDALGLENIGRLEPWNTGTVYGSIANPVAVGGAVKNIGQTLAGFGFVLLLLCFLASVAALFARLSQARGVERQQIKWFAYAAAVMGAGPLMMFLLGGGYSALSELMWYLGFFASILGFAFLPVATAIAILKYRLYDIDRVINRTLVYGSLTAALASIYFGAVILLQSVRRPHRREVHPCGGGIHPRDCCAVQPLKASHPILHRQALLSQKVRCKKDPGSVLGPVAKRNGPGGVERRPGRSGKGDYATSPRLAVATHRDGSEGYAD
jgi:hypothetical protein